MRVMYAWGRCHASTLHPHASLNSYTAREGCFSKTYSTTISRQPTRISSKLLLANNYSTGNSDAYYNKHSKLMAYENPAQAGNDNATATLDAHTTNAGSLNDFAADLWSNTDTFSNLSNRNGADTNRDKEPGKPNDSQARGMGEDGFSIDFGDAFGKKDDGHDSKTEHKDDFDKQLDELMASQLGDELGELLGEDTQDETEEDDSEKNKEDGDKDEDNDAASVESNALTVSASVANAVTNGDLASANSYDLGSVYNQLESEKQEVGNSPLAAELSYAQSYVADAVAKKDQATQVAGTLTASGGDIAELNHVLAGLNSGNTVQSAIRAYNPQLALSA